MPRVEELGPAYADAWETWVADEAEAWDSTTADGLSPTTRAASDP